MNWPTYTHPAQIDALPAQVIRHNRRNPHIDRRVIHVGAIDVWRDGVHLYRSYALKDAQPVDTWALSEFGPAAPNTHDSGMWAVPGVTDIADYPIPKPEGYKAIGSLDDVLNLLCTMFAIGQIPAPVDISAAPLKSMLTGRLARANRGYIVWTGQAAGVSVRMVIARSDNIAIALGNLINYRVRLERREVRGGGDDPDRIQATTMLFQGGKDAPAHTLISSAKTALGLVGWPMARVRKAELIWLLTGAPYTLTIERVDA